MEWLSLDSRGTYRSIVRCREVTTALTLTWVNWQPLTNVPIHVRNRANLALMQVHALSKGSPFKRPLMESMFRALGQAIGLTWVLMLFGGAFVAVVPIFAFDWQPSPEDSLVALLGWLLLTQAYLAGIWKHESELMRGALTSIGNATGDSAGAGRSGT